MGKSSKQQLTGRTMSISLAKMFLWKRNPITQLPLARHPNDCSSCFATHLEFSITYLAILILVSSGEHVLDDLVEKEEND